MLLIAFPEVAKNITAHPILILTTKYFHMRTRVRYVHFLFASFKQTYTDLGCIHDATKNMGRLPNIPQDQRNFQPTQALLDLMYIVVFLRFSLS